MLSGVLVVECVIDRPKAMLFHLPSSFICESSRPIIAAVVDAPDLKLCPEYLSEFSHIAFRAVRSSATNFGLVNGSPV